jgi:transcription initiation factor TFIIE subunit alpha
VGIFNRSLGWLINQMQVIDKVSIPATTSDSAFAQREEVPRPKAVLSAHMDINTNPNATAPRPAAVKGIVSGPQKIEVNITSDADNTAEAQKLAAAQKERTAAQNALPEWYTHSTVSNEMTAAGAREEAARREREAEMGLMNAGDAEEKKVVKDDGLADIFAEIEAEQAQELLKREQEGEEESEEEEDEEEFEFEDVPASGAVNGNEDRNGDGRPEAKRVKIEVDTPVSQVTGSGDAEDSEPEFEDV